MNAKQWYNAEYMGSKQNIFNHKPSSISLSAFQIELQTMSSFNSFDNAFLQNLMGRLQINPQNDTAPFLTQSLEDLISYAANLSDADECDDEYDDDDQTQLAREESKLENDIIKTILSGDTDSLKPNSGQAVAVGDHHICVGFNEEAGSDFRVWEWHGHIMLFDEDNGYTPEYVYGNYFERLLQGKAELKEKEVEEDVGNLGLRELIDGGDSAGGGRVLHRNVNTGSSSV